MEKISQQNPQSKFQKYQIKEKQFKLVGQTTIMIDDICQERNIPKRYPLIDCETDQERQGCDIIFAYDFNKVESFTTPIEKLDLQVPLDLIDEETYIGKADGLLKFEEFLPLHKTSLKDF